MTRTQQLLKLLQFFNLITLIVKSAIVAARMWYFPRGVWCRCCYCATRCWRQSRWSCPL